MTCKWGVFLISFFSILNLTAQTKFSGFHHLTRDNGLSSNRVNCIMEDNQGFMWFGTEDGLNKFNGYDFEVFRKNTQTANSIPDNSITHILEDTKKNNLWLATDRGLVYFDQIHQNFKLVLSTPLKDPNTGNISIYSLCFDTTENLWISKYNKLYILEQPSHKLKELSLKVNNSDLKPLGMRCIYRDLDNKMWLGCDNGLFIFNVADSTFSLVNNTLLQQIRVIKQDSKKGFWIGTDQAGLYYFAAYPGKNPTKMFNKENGMFAVNRVHEIIEDEPGRMYFVVRDGGLYYYDLHQDKLLHIKPDLYNSKSINSTAVISAFKSTNGMLWVGTYNSGINYIDKAAKKFVHYKVDFRPNGLLNNNIRALFQDSDDEIWIGTKENGGLSKFNPETNSFTNFKKSDKIGGLADDYIFSICELEKGKLLVGTFRQGLAVFNKKTQQFKYYKQNPNNENSLSDNRVYALYKDNSGLIWVGNFTNAQTFNPKTKSFKTIDNIERPRCFLDEDENNIWMGTKEHGLYLYNKKTKELINYLTDTQDSTAISSNDVFDLEKDQYGNLWIATKRGVDMYDKRTNSFRHFGEKDGMPSDWICGLLIDDDQNIWVSTTNGIAKLYPNSKQVKTYDIIDGLQGNEFEGYVALKTSDGHMLFGGRNGFNYFLPNEITDNTALPKVVISGFKLYNKEVPVLPEGSILNQHISFTKKLKLKYNESAISFDYAALNYTSPEKNKYAYKLFGLDSDWVQAGTKRTAVYTNVPPGKYTFKVIGSNNDNYWNEKGASIDITILNPYWKTIWAYMVYLLLIIIVLFFIRKLLIYRIEQRNLLQIERIEKEQIQEINQMKLRFFTNISHEFRTPLTLITAPLNKLMSYKNHNDEQAYLYKIMKNNVQRMLGLVNELMDFRKAEQGQLKLKVSKTDIVEFMQQIVDCFESQAKDKGINFSMNYQLDYDEEIWLDKRLIDKVVFNLLSNAFKYTPDNGRIEVFVVVEKGLAKISVINSGQGIPLEKQDEIFNRFYQIDDANYSDIEGSGIGLAFSKRLIEVHYGKIGVVSDAGKGATFNIEFPINKDAFSEVEQLKSSQLVPETKRYMSHEQVSPPEVEKEKGKKDVRLLIVEDNIEMREFIKSHFKHYDLLWAENGKIGCQIANKKVPDIIISDVMMPVMNGLDLCKHLKSQFATSHIPIILLTAKSEITQKIEGIDMGADAYIEKPFDIQYLESRVKNLLQQRSALRKRFSSEAGAIPDDMVVNVYEQKFMEKAQNIINDNLSNSEFSVEDFGFELGLSRSQLFRKFKSIFELKPSEFIRNERLKASKKLLLERNYNVNEISELVGFKSASYFITSFKKFYGKPPAEFVTKTK